MNLDELKQLAAKLDVDFDTISAVAAPAVLLFEAPGGSETTSWFGGDPLLPNEMPWPMWDPARFDKAELEQARRRLAEFPELPYWPSRVASLEKLVGRDPIPLSFVCQLDCSTLPSAQLGEDLPSHGLLSFFAELRHGGACMGRIDDVPPWRVYWFDQPSKLNLKTRSADADEMRLKHQYLSAQAAISVPEICTIDGEVVLTDEDPKFEQFLDVMEEQNARATNQIGGHRVSLQDPTDDPRKYAAMLQRGFDIWNPPPAALESTLADHAQEWELILQVATDYAESWSWEGVMTFWRQKGPWEPGLQRVQVYYDST